MSCVSDTYPEINFNPKRAMKLKKLLLFFFYLALSVFLLIPAFMVETGISAEEAQQTSDHFDGLRYFNPSVPGIPPDSSSGQISKRRVTWWVWNWILGNDWPEWPKAQDVPPGPRPVVRVPTGVMSITPIGHATFLIQIDGLNILTDPIWSNRPSPISWAGPKRHIKPGILFEDLPPIDIVLVSHNHYDHLDLPTLERLAEKGTPHAIVPLGNIKLVKSAGIPAVDELDWWQSVRISPDVTITLVPAQHFSLRNLANYNKTLWGGFVISGSLGNVFYSGDTGYGPHFKEIARRFSPIRVALLPIAPFRPQKMNDTAPAHRSIIHMGPAEAVKAHLDLGVPFTVAAHFQAFRLGMEGFDDPATVLTSALAENNLKPDAFVVPVLGQAIVMPPMTDELPTGISAEKPIAVSLSQSVERGKEDKPANEAGAKLEQTQVPEAEPAPEDVFISLNVQFDTGKADIKLQYHNDIKKIADAMNKYPETSIIIEGHTDNAGKELVNIKLSYLRAAKIKAYLVRNFGIGSSRIRAIGYDYQKPIASNKTAEGRQLNRRGETQIETNVASSVLYSFLEDSDLPQGGFAIVNQETIDEKIKSFKEKYGAAAYASKTVKSSTLELYKMWSGIFSHCAIRVETDPHSFYQLEMQALPDLEKAGMKDFHKSGAVINLLGMTTDRFDIVEFTDQNERAKLDSKGRNYASMPICIKNKASRKTPQWYRNCLRRYAASYNPANTLKAGKRTKIFEYNPVTHNCCNFAEEALQACGLEHCFDLGKSTSLYHETGPLEQ
jgi:L-ascorbate metabolism protein UlaG (beta-lactamase superfamily)/outer membrane protein OmpA-like peptidoglycan-associated protein